jgi:hypothetical protein
MKSIRGAIRLTLIVVIALQAALSPARAQSSSIAPGYLADSVIAAITVIHKSPTLAEWHRLHPTDSIEWAAISDAGDFDGNACASTSGALPLAGNQRGLRVAHFYVPLRRPGQALPVSRRALRYQCRLGNIEFFASGADSDSAHASFRVDSLRLTATLPRATHPSFSLPWFGDVRNADLIWQVDSTRVFGLDHTPWQYMGAEARPPFAYFLAVTSPIALSPSEKPWQVAYTGVYTPEPRPLQHPQILDTLLALGGLRGADASRFTALINRKVSAPMDTVHSPLRDAEFAAAINALVNPERVVSPDQQVGRLLAADWMIESADWAFVYWHAGLESEDPAAKRTRDVLAAAVGAGFGFDQLGSDWMYNHALLARAISIGGTGPAADRAFIATMQRQFVTAGDACLGLAGIDSVLTHGAAYLARRPGSPIRGEVELMMAEAYGDQVAVASGAGYSEGDDVLVTGAPRDPMFARAMIHFRRGFALVGNNLRANEDWNMAWLLAAGLSPLGTRAYCVSD